MKRLLAVALCLLLALVSTMTINKSNEQEATTPSNLTVKELDFFQTLKDMNKIKNEADNRHQIASANISRGESIKFEELEVMATGYTWTGHKTRYAGYPTSKHTIAVDPRVIPPMSTVQIISDDPKIAGIYIAEDTGGLIKGNKIDIYFDTEREAVNWGIRKVEVKFHRR